jgi:hypothetical protein
MLSPALFSYPSFSLTFHGEKKRNIFSVVEKQEETAGLETMKAFKKRLISGRSLKNEEQR